MTTPLSHSYVHFPQLQYSAKDFYASVDEDGLVYGMQYATGHLHLGFDIKDQEIILDGKKQKVSNSPFLHVGQCIHVDKIKEFLKEKNIQYFEA